MSVPALDVFLLAAPQAGIEHSQLVSNLAAAFKKDPASIEKMLVRPRNLVKTDVTPEAAAKYKVLIEKAGGQCELVAREPVPTPGEATQNPPAPAPASPAAAEAPVASVAETAIAAAIVIAEAPAAVANPESAEANTAAVEVNIEVQPSANASTAAAQETGDPVVVCYCGKCGSAILVGQHKCATCLTPVAQYRRTNRITAGLLGFFLGGFGAHRLYLGQWWGSLYLIFFSTLIPSLVAITEAIIFWLTTKTEWQARHGRVPKAPPVLVAVYVLALVIGVAIAGVIAAIAVPSYREYSLRSKIQNAMPLVEEARTKVADYIKTTGTYPSQNAEVGLANQFDGDPIEVISLQNEAILLVVYQMPGSKQKHTILWVPHQQNGQIIWDCSAGSMPEKYRPAECRGSPVINKPDTSAADKAAAAAKLAKQLFSEDKRIAIQVPLSWASKELLPGAIIGAANLLDENYVVVMEDAKIDFDSSLTLADYSRNIQLQLAENIKDGMVQGEPRSLTVAGLPAEQFIFPGVVNGIRIAYMVTVIEANTHFYRVLGWTLESRMEKNQELLKNISESLVVQQ